MRCSSRAAFVLQALCSNYLMVMLAFALCVGAARATGAVARAAPDVAAGSRCRRRRRAPAAAVSASRTTACNQTQGLVRTIDDVRIYSASWPDYLATAGRLHYSLWAYRFAEDRTALFPGLHRASRSRCVAIASAARRGAIGARAWCWPFGVAGRAAVARREPAGLRVAAGTRRRCSRASEPRRAGAISR